MVVVRALTLEPDSLGLYLPLTSSVTLSKLPYLAFVSPSVKWRYINFIGLF